MVAQKEIKIGTMATLVGPYAVMGEDGIRGIQLAIAEFGGRIGDSRLVLFQEATNAIPDSATSMAEQLLDQAGVDFIVGPLSGNEGLAMRDFAKTRPNKAFINGNAAAQEITLRDPAPNFFSFSTSGVQWVAGLGTYAYQTLGYRRVATLAEDYSFPHAQIGGFMIEFGRAGGQVVQKRWVSLGTVDFSQVIAAIPKDIDALFVVLAGVDAVNFLEQFERAGDNLPPLMGGSTLTDQTVLGASTKLSDRFVGVECAGPIADRNPAPAWQSFVNAYRARYPRGLPSPSLFAYGFYVNAKAALLALRTVDGDLSDGQARFKAALTSLKFEAPTGPVWLDHNRQAISDMFITVVDQKEDGQLYNKLVQTVPGVNATLGMPEADFLALGPLGRDNPPANGQPKVS